MERSNIAYGIVLTVLVIALATVGVLLLRKRSSLPQAQIAPSGRTVTAPTTTLPLDKHPFIRPWKVGDPAFHEGEPDVETSEEEEFLTQP
ncbi:hypothetical protein L0Y59_05290 [Candidatus Uhrbacteria bacterium]|nr:hypothetical protein [Candidatus Uhrbacteria bacterium]